jgi:hypothetical protein
VPGDIAVFTAALAPGARELRVHAKAAIRALVVSVQNPLPDGHAEAWSWLLRGDEWTPRYALGAAPEARSDSWQRGGSELFDSPELANEHRAKSRTQQPAAAPREPEPGLGTLAWRWASSTSCRKGSITCSSSQGSCSGPCGTSGRSWWR